MHDGDRTEKSAREPIEIKKAYISPDTPEEVMKEVVKGQGRYSMLGLFLGALCIVGGVVLVALGVAGSVIWNITIAGVDSKLVNAGPGVVLIVVGLLIVFVTRYIVKIGK